MKVSDYIVDFLEKKGVKHAYGYQGTMIAHLVESIGKSKIENHCVYNEQAAAFAAVGAAKATGKCTFAYATSGPGAINLVSGIADAYYDSVPVLFITGQVNTTEYTGISQLRQQAFQETKVVSIVKDICKYTSFVQTPESIVEEINKAWEIANTGRKGPVVLDIPMNVQRADIDVAQVQQETIQEKISQDTIDIILNELNASKRPVFVLGNGVGKDCTSRNRVKELIKRYRVPVITTLLGKDLIDTDDELNMGALGAAYGHRCANLIAYEKADLIISFGASLCRRQTGGNTKEFAKNAKIIRIDIDSNELLRTLHDEIHVPHDVNSIIEEILSVDGSYECKEWLEKCKYIKKKYEEFDNSCEGREPNKIIGEITSRLENNIVVSDVGQHMMWVMQSAHVKNTRLLFSGGHGAMGFALPAAIGAQIETGKPTMCIAGDGAFQMNIQELQWVFREKIPLCMVVFNNSSLGLIRQQQDDFFNSYYVGSTSEGGYLSPDFKKVAEAYNITSFKVESISELKSIVSNANMDEPLLIEYVLEPTTVAIPKTYFGETMVNQRPYVDNEILEVIKDI